ncbi:hypothetical protein, partial [Escherichia coli]|uniref:hypothetical protein n=1 Tax=Escherichia coli TaxID=562 RepID=UPI001BFC29C0
ADVHGQHEDDQVVDPVRNDIHRFHRSSGRRREACAFIVIEASRRSGSAVLAHRLAVAAHQAGGDDVVLEVHAEA